MSPSHNEQSPLLGSKKPLKTPLPWGQFSMVLIMQLAEPVTSSVIYPFCPDLVRRLGYPEEDVGHYVGLLQSLFFFTQSLTVMHWSRVSDLIGRKPVILSGLCGLSLSMYCFGLSTTFWGLVLSRCLNGALNGNIGVMKSIIAELTDSTNVAQAVSFLPLSWNLGSMIGPILGGFLSRPAERWPELFGDNEFLKQYPYFLACAVPASFSLVVFFVTAVFFKETIKSPMSISRLFRIRNDKQSSGVLESVAGATDPSAGEAVPSQIKQVKPPTFWKLATNKRVMLAGGAYAFLSLVDIAYTTIQPTFLSTPVHYGGLGWSPSDIGRLLSIRAILNGLYQVMFFAKLVEKFGIKRVYMAGILAFFPIFASFKIINVAAQDGMMGLSWALVSLQVLLSLFISSAYGTVMMYINSSAPNTRSIGATNGVCQMSVSIMRAIGPTLGNSLFSLTLKRGYLGGTLVYVVLLAATVVATFIGTLLPSQTWVIEDDA